MGAWLASQTNHLGLVSVCLTSSISFTKTSFFVPPSFAMSCVFVPSDVLALVLSQLDLVDFCAAAGTCHAWHEVAIKKTAWPRAVDRILLLPSTCHETKRSLSKTVWAGCRSLALPHARNVTEAYVWMERMSTELVHVTSLSIECGGKGDVPVISATCRAWLSRLVSLHTNRPILVHETSREHLTSLKISSYRGRSGNRWVKSISAMVSLKHVQIGCILNAQLLGRALGELANAHRKLHSIEFSGYSNEVESTTLLNGLLDGSDLASIRALVNAPSFLDVLRRALERLPSLTAYTTSHTKPIHNVPPGLTSLALDCNNLPHHAWLMPYLANLHDLSIRSSTHGLASYYCPRLRSLTLPTHYDGHYVSTHIGIVAPHIEHLALCTPVLWTHPNPTTQDTTRPGFPNLSRLSKLQHVELLPCTVPGWEHTAPATVTYALLTGMLSSSTWRHVTSHIAPVPIRIDTVLAPSSLVHIRWHVPKGRTQLRFDTYRPRIQASGWRSWVPGLCSRQVVWDLCLRLE
jgi:hypothetical protein